MKNQSVGKVHWEVWSVFNWGSVVKSTYKTRDLARAGMRASKGVHVPNADYVKYELYKVTQIDDIVGSGDSVMFLKKVR